MGEARRLLEGDQPLPASPWVERFAALIPTGGGPVLDVACGAGRHARLLADRGHRVVAVDRDLRPVADLEGHPSVELVEADLEDGSPFPLTGRRFAGVVVTRYLHRPLLPHLLASLEDGGLLIYETFSVDQPRFGRPTDPRFLLRPGELLEAVRGAARVLAYEDLVVVEPRPAAVQRIAARHQASPGSGGGQAGPPPR